MKKFFYFGIVGTVGFIVDTLILLYLVYILQLPIYFSRFISFIIAVFITWLLNRNLTFKNADKKHKKSKEFFYYLATQSTGALINFIIFFTLVYTTTYFYNNLIFSMAIASIVALFFNFYVIKNRIYI